MTTHVACLISRVNHIESSTVTKLKISIEYQYLITRILIDLLLYRFMRGEKERGVGEDLYRLFNKFSCFINIFSHFGWLPWPNGTSK